MGFQLLLSELEFEVKIVSCEIQKEAEWGSEHVGFVTILGLLCSLVIVGTIIDVISLKKKEEVSENRKPIKEDCCSRFWDSFSARSSLRRLLAPSQSRFTCMAGIRVLTLLWIVLANTYFFPYVGFFFRYKRLITSLSFKEDFLYGVLANPSPAIDSLFVMSGILIAYESGSRLVAYGEDPKLWTGFLRRFLRLFPAATFTVWLFLLFPLFGDGPQWQDLVNRNVDVCRKTWWRSLLFIQNFWKFQENCMMHTWFLSLLVQYSFISVIIIWMLFRKPVVGLLTSVCCVVGSALALGYFNVDNRFPPTLSLAAADVELYVEFMDKDYLRTYSHLGPFCLGILLGYLLIKRPKIGIPPVVLWLGCLLSLGIFLAVIYGLYRFPYTGETYITMAAIYASCYRVVWALAVAWVCFVCATGHGGVLNQFLSWQGFVQLDRLSYLVYLLHPLVVFFFAGRARERVFLGHPEMVLNFLGILSLTVLMAFLCYVLFQRPLKYLDTFMFARRMRIKGKDHDEEVALPDPETIINMYKAEGKNSTASTAGEVSGFQTEVFKRRKRSSSVMFRDEPEILSKETAPCPTSSGSHRDGGSSLKRERKKSILSGNFTPEVLHEETVKAMAEFASTYPEEGPSESSSSKVYDSSIPSTTKTDEDIVSTTKANEPTSPALQVEAPSNEDTQKDGK